MHARTYTNAHTNTRIYATKKRKRKWTKDNLLRGANLRAEVRKPIETNKKTQTSFTHDIRKKKKYKMSNKRSLKGYKEKKK